MYTMESIEGVPKDIFQTSRVYFVRYANLMECIARYCYIKVKSDGSRGLHQVTCDVKWEAPEAAESTSYKLSVTHLDMHIIVLLLPCLAK